MAEDAAAVFQRLLLLLGLDEEDTLEQCLAAYAAPCGTIFGVPTAVLSRFLKLLKAQSPPESRPQVEEAFMKFVTKVRAAAELRVGEREREGCGWEGVSTRAAGILPTVSPLPSSLPAILFSSRLPLFCTGRRTMAASCKCCTLWQPA
jgi:hypothetical protein